MSLGKWRYKTCARCRNRFRIEANSDSVVCRACRARVSKRTRPCIDCRRRYKVKPNDNRSLRCAACKKKRRSEVNAAAQRRERAASKPLTSEQMEKLLADLPPRPKPQRHMSIGDSIHNLRVIRGLPAVPAKDGL